MARTLGLFFYVAAFCMYPLRAQNSWECMDGPVCSAVQSVLYTSDNQPIVIVDCSPSGRENSILYTSSHNNQWRAIDTISQLMERGSIFLDSNDVLYEFKQ